MPTQLQLEGPELEPLLARVRAEHGAGARIVSAEKVRSGGLGGFFAKQSFEITVELDDVTLPAAPRPATLLDLADEVSATERSAAAVSTESTGFAAVMAQLGASTGSPAPRRPASPPVAYSAVPAPRRAPAPRRRAAAPRPAPSTEVALRRSSSVAVRPAPSAAAVRTVSAVAVRPAPAAKKARTPRSTGALQAAGRTTAAAPTPLQEQLTGLGLPAHLQPTRAAGGVEAALTDSLRALPKAPRPANRAGSVLAVVGPLAEATAVARQLAGELDLPRTAVVVADRTELACPETARRRRDTWRKRARTTVVVVDTPVSAAGALRARAHLDALEPSSTWAVVEATRKSRDVGAWAQAIGCVDALALTGLDETADPAAVLELGIPVGRLDRRRATPAAWARLLADRVAA